MSVNDKILSSALHENILCRNLRAEYSTHLVVMVMLIMVEFAPSHYMHFGLPPQGKLQ